MPSLKKQTHISLLLLGSLFGILGLSLDPTFHNAWLHYVASRYATLIGPLIALLPFSISELLWLGLFIFVGIQIKRSLGGFRYHQWKKVWLPLHLVFNVSLGLITFYTSTTGLAYSREPVPIPQWTDQVESEQFEPIITYFQDDFIHVASTLTFDEKGSVKRPHTISDLNTLIHTQFSSLDGSYFYPYSTTIKPMLFSFLYTEFHITGIHLGLTTEALFNAHIPDALLPFTMAHELAHAKGVMREEDANLVAMYLCLTSDDAYMRYSGYFYTFYALLNLSRYMGDDQAYSRFYQALPLTIRNDYRYQSIFWGQYTLLHDLATFMNDVYLRIMGTEGVSSYVDAPITGTVVEGDQTIEVITQFSPFQQLFFWLYFQG